MVLIVFVYWVMLEWYVKLLIIVSLIFVKIMGCVCLMLLDFRIIYVFVCLVLLDLIVIR